jgi:putative transposase
MTDELRMGLERLLRKAEIGKDVDFLRQGVQLLAQALMELEFEEHLGAGRHERTPERSGYRNGYREREWETRVGKIDLKVPRARDSSFYPSLLEPRLRAERALAAVVQEAYVHGVSTRKVDALVQALGMSGASRRHGTHLACGGHCEL